VAVAATAPTTTLAIALTTTLRTALKTALRRRPFRVVTLCLAIAVMSAVDLYLTLLYLTHTGMSEANPLARIMIAYQSPAVLASWKALTVFLCLGILYLFRDRRSAELGAWTGAIVLAWLMTHWATYIDEKIDLGMDFQLVSVEIDPRFVRLNPIAP
jgi:hypothetical protein